MSTINEMRVCEPWYTLEFVSPLPPSDKVTTRDAHCHHNEHLKRQGTAGYYRFTL